MAKGNSQRVRARILRKYGQIDGDTLPAHIEKEIRQVSFELIKKTNTRHGEGKSLQGVCSYGDCLVLEKLLWCAKCLKTVYCSKEHQKLDWKRHKVECIPPS